MPWAACASGRPIPMGMRLVGVYERVGYKLGRWHDVAWYGMRLSEQEGDPAEQVRLPEIAGG